MSEQRQTGHSSTDWHAYNEMRRYAVRRSLAFPVTAVALISLRLGLFPARKNFVWGLALGFDFLLAAWAIAGCVTVRDVRLHQDRDASYWERKVIAAWHRQLYVALVLALCAIGTGVTGLVRTAIWPVGAAIPLLFWSGFLLWRWWKRRADPADVFAPVRLL